VTLLDVLALLPHTDETQAAFVRGFLSVPTNAEHNGRNARAALAEAATHFFDPSLTDVLLRGSRGLERDAPAMVEIVGAAITIMDDARTASVKRRIDSIPPPREEGPIAEQLVQLPKMFELAQELSAKCRDDASCYLSAAKEPRDEWGPPRIVGARALHRVGQLGGPETVQQIVDALPAIRSARLRYVASVVIDHYLPHGSLEVADRLQAIVDEGVATLDVERQASDKPLRDMIVRLRARTE
jgi:hypothetical protein